MDLRERDLRELREQLGLDPAATPDEVMAVSRELEEFLSAGRVPARLRQWAERQLESSRQAAGLQSEPARPKAAARPAPDDLPDFFDEDQAVTATPSRRGAAERPRTSRAGGGRPARQARRAGPSYRGLVLVIALGLALAGPVLASQLLGSGQPSQGGIPAIQADQPVAPQLDEARVAELKAAVEKDPKDADALFELGEMHFQAGRWQDSIDWFTRLLAVDPSNLHAQLDVGTANFNLGRFDVAGQVWEAVVAKYPTDPQVHYNLGFLYANSDERDLERAFKEWQTVIQLAPGSDLAKTAQAHLDALRKP